MAFRHRITINVTDPDYSERFYTQGSQHTGLAGLPHRKIYPPAWLVVFTKVETLKKPVYSSFSRRLQKKLKKLALTS